MGTLTMAEISTSFTKFTNAFTAATAPPPAVETTSQCVERAIVFAETHETWLSPEDLVTFIEFLSNPGPAYANAPTAYLAFRNEATHKGWISLKLNQLRQTSLNMFDFN